MKKGWKITLISLGSLLGLVIILVAVALWLVFTPGKLTKIVNSLSDKYILCESHFESVDLSLFKTFPNAGLKVNDVVVVNPMEGFSYDTLARIDNLTVGVDVKALLKHGDIIVRELDLSNVVANLYIAPDGSSNFDIFPSGDEEEDTTSSFELPDKIDVEKITLKNINVRLDDDKDNLFGRVAQLNLTLKGSCIQQQLDANIKLSADELVYASMDTNHTELMSANICDMELKADAQGGLENLLADLSLKVNRAEVMASEKEWVNHFTATHGDLLCLKGKVNADLENMRFTLDKTSLTLDKNNTITLDGTVSLPSDSQPLTTDLTFNTNKWQASEVLPLLPAEFTTWMKGMDLDAKLQLEGDCKGQLKDSIFPLITAHLDLSKGHFAYPKAIPYKLTPVSADIDAVLDLSQGATSSAKVNSLEATTGKNKLSVTGKVDDLLGDMALDAIVKGNVRLPDLEVFLPDTLPLDMKGSASLNLHAKSKLADITSLNLKQVKASGTVNLSSLNVRYDSIHVNAPKLDVALQIPAKKQTKKVRELIDARIQGGALHVEMDNNGLKADVTAADIKAGLSNILDKKQKLAVSYDIDFGKLHATMDSLSFQSDSLAFVGNICYDSTQDNILRQLNPDLDIDLHRTVVFTSSMPEAVRMPGFHFNYVPGTCRISEADIRWGVSDYHLSGTVHNVEDWLSHEGMLEGNLQFVSNYTDVDQLMSILSGMGSDSDTLQKQREEDKVSKEAKPFIVPKDMNVTLHTSIRKAAAFGNDLKEVAGDVHINDGVAVLDQVGFICKAARMQLTAMYKSPRPNNLFVGLDFHLLDIEVHELIDMIPTIDTLVPMLAAFDGQANFHLAAECSLNAFYQPKMSTLLGAAAIDGKNLVVMENNTVSTIAELLQLKDWRDKDSRIVIDSLDVEATVFRKEIEVFPFLLSLHKYQLVAAGRHTLDNAYNYHVEIVRSPLLARFGVDVAGVMPNIKPKLGQVQYAELYRPSKKGAVDSQVLKLKSQIKESLERNVRIQ